MLLHSLNYFVINMINNMTDEELVEFSRINAGYKIERSVSGNITMAPTYSDTGFFNLKIAGKFLIWNEETNLGLLFDSSAGFRLNNGALKSPDLSWVSKERWQALPKEKRQGYADICPDFVLELKSNSDNLAALKEKMLEYIENGAQLAWLIDRDEQKAYIYRADGSISIAHSFDKKLSGEMVLPDFELDLGILKEEI